MKNNNGIQHFIVDFNRLQILTNEQVPNNFGLVLSTQALIQADCTCVSYSECSESSKVAEKTCDNDLDVCCLGAKPIPDAVFLFCFFFSLNDSNRQFK